jgi:hypothetical protein
MADLLLERKANGLHDFVRDGADLARTSTPEPAILRLLIQGSWLGDDGERAGQSLPDVVLSTSQTDSQIQRIVEARMSVLIKQGRLESATLLRVVRAGDRAFIEIQVKPPGQEPATIQVPVTC